MRRCVGREPASRLRELPLATRPVAAAGVVPGDRDMDEALEEVPLLVRRLTPFVLELLVRVEVRSVADQLESSLQAHRPIIGLEGRRC